MTASPALVWFRDDLRLADNPALNAALATGSAVLCVFIMDEKSDGLRPLGGAARWWLHHSLGALATSIERIGGRLDILAGNGAETIEAIAVASGAKVVFWNRRYGLAERAVDTAAKASLTARGIQGTSFKSHLLFEPFAIKNKSGEPFKVFSPFWRAALTQPEPLPPLPAPKQITAAPYPATGPQVLPLSALTLLPTQPDWSHGLAASWRPGEQGAQERWQAFARAGLHRYAEDRNRPDLPATSRLSPHLRFGEISPRTLWHATHFAANEGRASARDAEKFLSEIGWREFSYHLLWQAPELASRNFQARFDAFAFEQTSPAAIRAWHMGQTGYPIVDAGMRELWQTGYMHNRVRMIAASFLIKHMLVDWREGEKWFWDTLCDADGANNAASWQWVAGSGADAAPYFRIFNPVLQGEKFDPNGTYVRQYVPELADLPNQWLHNPWAAPPAVLKNAGVSLGKTYPLPLVDHDAARGRALAAFAALAPKA